MRTAFRQQSICTCRWRRRPYTSPAATGVREIMQQPARNKETSYARTRYERGWNPRDYSALNGLCTALCCRRTLGLNREGMAMGETTKPKVGYISFSRIFPHFEFSTPPSYFPQSSPLLKTFRCYERCARPNTRDMRLCRWEHRLISQQQQSNLPSPVAFEYRNRLQAM